ncbi:hypothetical protein DFH08DRAFT_966916 [Mycena albidolilacea]|uniref:Uncharacterized protein n=1 Tax=Mycena albidolilacea TaxID=1033008 RepID=A0AAD6ZMM4_9AGAR|nr:hypothetical protein DFH08DRAFT_966916 [Mycena albidolilacea]
MSKPNRQDVAAHRVVREVLQALWTISLSFAARTSTLSTLPTKQPPSKRGVRPVPGPPPTIVLLEWPLAVHTLARGEARADHGFSADDALTKLGSIWAVT